MFSNIAAITCRNAYYVQGFLSGQRLSRNAYYVQGFLSGQRLMRTLNIIYLFILFFDRTAWHVGS